MARNGLAGVFKGKSKSAEFYHKNPEARAKKLAYDSEYHKTPKRRKYRGLLNAINRKKGNKVGDGKDEAHVSKTKTVSQSQSKNRGDKKHNFYK